MRKALIFPAMLLAAVPACAQGTLTRAQVTTIGNTIADNRLIVLQDSTPISYCNINEFWDESGALLFTKDAATLSRYKNRSECPKEGDISVPTNSSVAIHRLEIHPDSVIIIGRTVRGKRKILEFYTVRWSPTATGPSYSVVWIQVAD